MIMATKGQLQKNKKQRRTKNKKRGTHIRNKFGPLEKKKKKCAVIVV